MVLYHGFLLVLGAWKPALTGLPTSLFQSSGNLTLLWRGILMVALYSILDLFIGYWREKKWILPSSAWISGLILSLVLAPTAWWGIAIGAPVLASLGKQFIRFRRKHIFNPAALALVILGIAFPSQGIVSWWGASWGIIPFVIIGLLFVLVAVAAMWKVFTKAGQPGWAAIVPFYNTYVLLKIVGRPGWWLLLLFIPLVNIAILIIVMVARHNERMVYYALMATAGSIAGCLLMYFIGWKGGEALLARRFRQHHIERAMKFYARYGMFTILVPALLPPPAPFKVFVLLAGVVKMPLLTFTTAVFIGRSLRYFVEGILAIRYGQAAMEYVNANGKTVGIISVVAVLFAGLAYFLLRYWLARRRAAAALQPRLRPRAAPGRELHPVQHPADRASALRSRRAVRS
jgi:membrane protein YqaA with SNARE-associated domain